MVASFHSTFSRDQYVEKDIGHRGYVSLEDAATRLTRSSRYLDRKRRPPRIDAPHKGGSGGSEENRQTAIV